MGTHKVVTTDAELDAALEQAKKLQEEPRVTAVEYKDSPELDMLVLRFNDGRRHLIARENIEGLQDATPKQIAQVEILGSGTGLHWPELRLDLYVPSLLQNIYGTKRWMAQLAPARRHGQEPGKAKGIADQRPQRYNVARLKHSTTRPRQFIVPDRAAGDEFGGSVG